MIVVQVVCETCGCVAYQGQPPPSKIRRARTADGDIETYVFLALGSCSLCVSASVQRLTRYRSKCSGDLMMAGGSGI